MNKALQNYECEGQLSFAFNGNIAPCPYIRECGTYEVIIARNEPPTYNKLCRNYSEIRNRDNKVIERTCVVGMDMCYCSKKCAYATNNVCSSKG